LKELKHFVLEPLRYAKVNSVGHKVFDYKFRVAEDNDSVTIWLLKFYDKIIFIGATVSNVI